MSRSLLELLATIKPLCKTASASIGSGPDSSAASMVAKTPGGGGGGMGTVIQMIHDAQPSEQAIKDQTAGAVKNVNQVYRQGRGDMARAGVANVANQVLTGARAGQMPSMRDSGSLTAGMNAAKNVSQFASQMAGARGRRRRLKADAKAQGESALTERNDFVAKLQPYLPAKAASQA